MNSRKSSEERMKEIVQTGMNILHEEDKSSLTIGNIADRLELTEAAVYKHFKSKEEVVKKMAEKAFSSEFMEVEELNFNEPEKLLNTVLKNLFEKLEENPEVTAILFHDEIFVEYPEVKELFRKHKKEKKAKLKFLVSKGKSSGAFDQGIEPETFATIMMGSIRLTVMNWRESNFAYSLEEKSEELSRQLSKILEV